jgi:hypothetical protein
MKVRPVYNLEFPSWCIEMNLFGYRFTRVDDYQERFLSLQHLTSSISEFSEEPNTGTHSLTAFVELPDSEEEAVLDWSGSNNTALMDILLLLALFTGRDVFSLKAQNSKQIKNNRDVIIADPRIYSWGGVLRCSIPYKQQPIEPEPLSYDIGFEEGINQIYKLIRSDGWQKEYTRGYYLFLAKMAFHRQNVESSFVQCWTIWEHLFAILNRQWLSDRQIQLMSSVEKISFLLVKFALTGETNNASRKRIETLAEIRNRLVHFGMFPEHGSVHDDAILFIRLTEFVIAKTLELSPSNVFNTVEALEKFLSKKENAI